MPRYASSSSAAVGVLASTVTPEFDWELLYDVYAVRLRRIIQRKVGPAMTEDVLQETFLRAFRNRHTVDPERPIGPWLITIALRAATDAQRRQLRTVDSEPVEPTCEETGFGVVEEELVRRARRIGIKHALASLNTKERRMLEAVAVEGMPYEQVAEAECMTPVAVKSALARARTNFRSSYYGFTRSTGLFGGAVGAAVWRLRTRLHRYQGMLAEHGTAFGAATLTVFAVGVAAYPATRPIPSSASEGPVVATVAGESAGALVPDDALPGSGDGPGSAVGGAPAPVQPSGPAQVRTVATATQVARQENRFAAESTTDVDTPTADVRHFFVFVAHCDGGLAPRTMCWASDNAPAAPAVP